MNSLVQVATDSQTKDLAGNGPGATGGARQRRASESDTPSEGRSGADASASSPAAMIGAVGVQAPKNVDILQMLSRAQDEYDKAKDDVTAPAASRKVWFNNVFFFSV